MKCLEVSKGKGYFRNANDEMEEISKITKNDILRFLDIITNPDETFEMDEYGENCGLENEAHKIIYGHLHQKLCELLENKTRFCDESEAMYQYALEKYRVE